MLDCSLDLKPLLRFLPESLIGKQRIENLAVWKNPDDVEAQDARCLRECCNQLFVFGKPEVCPPNEDHYDYSRLDCILISNHTSMLALPFITEVYGFKGQIYATDPTIQLGKLMMEELVEYFGRSQLDPADPVWKQQTGGVRDWMSTVTDNPKHWRSLYSLDEVRKCINRIHVIAFRERIDLFGRLRVSAHSSGYCIGSCNWLLETPYDNIVYMSRSTSFTAHPKPLDLQSLTNADVLMMTGLTQVPGISPDPSLGQLDAAVTQTLRNGGNVLIPCYPTGITYDLLEFLAQSLYRVGLTNIPIYFISPVADSSLAFANIYAEWLNESKQAKVYLPEEPFAYAESVRTGHLKHFKAIYEGLNEEFRTPCLVFAGHPSLRFGDVVHFMELWAADPQSLVVLTEPDFCQPEVLAPFQPLAMKAIFCPIDTSLDFAQATKTLRDLNPRSLCVPEEFLKPPLHLPTRTDLMIQNCEGAIGFRRYQPILIPLKQTHERVRFEATMADGFDFTVDHRRGFSTAPMFGNFSAFNNVEIRI